jgi:fucose permease
MTQNLEVRNRVYRAASASLFIYSASAIALPICLVRISEELGFNLTQGGSLGFITSIEQFFVLLASSFAAARFGKIKVLRSGLLILALGLALFTLSGSFLSAVLLMLFIGFGNALLEALLTPLVEDLYPNDNGSKMNLLHAFWPMGTIAAVLILGQLLSVDVGWRPLFLGLAALVLLINFWYPASGRIDLPRSRADFSHMREIISLPRFWVFGLALAFAAGAEGAFTFWSASFIQIHYGELPRAGALGTAAFAVGMAVGRISSSHIAGRIGLKRLMVTSLTLGLAVSCTFFFITSLAALYLFLLAMGLCIACLWPSIQSYAGSELGVDPTVLMIFLSCLGLPGFSSATLLMGIIGDARGLKASFIIAPIYLAVALILIAIEKRIPARRRPAIEG